MKLIGIAGFSGNGKTTRIEKLVPIVVRDGLKVSLIKHAHHEFDVDTPGKDSYRHRHAGCTEVLVSSSRRWVLMHELRTAGEPSLDEQLKHFSPCDLVIVEGSINDRRLYPSGYRDAVTAVWDSLEALYPDAAIVVLGPAPQVLPIEPATAGIDGDLAAFAAERGWWYISPIAESWITPDNYPELIDTSDTGRDHPSTAGHAYLAERVATAIAGMTEATDVVADAPLDEDVVTP